MDFNDEHPKSSFEEERGSENENHHSKRMNELEKRLKAIANCSKLQEAEVVRPYLAEWDVGPYPPKFNAPIL